LEYGRSIATTLAYTAAVDLTKELLEEEGLGVLSEIDVGRTLHETIGVTFGPYCILGVCVPQLAHRALKSDARVGLLLPCNVTVQRAGDRTIVSVIDARALLSIAGDPSLTPIADEVNTRLGRVLNALAMAG
jgi:uncharacterized protein (DUF302 family)